MKTYKKQCVFIVFYKQTRKHTVKPKKNKEEPIKPYKKCNKQKTIISTHYSQHQQKLLFFVFYSMWYVLLQKNNVYSLFFLYFGEKNIK